VPFALIKGLTRKPSGDYVHLVTARLSKEASLFTVLVWYSPGPDARLVARVTRVERLSSGREEMVATNDPDRVRRLFDEWLREWERDC